MHNQSFTFLIRHCNFTFFYTTHFYIQRHVTPKNHEICNTEQIEHASFPYQSVSCTQMKTPKNYPPLKIVLKISVFILFLLKFEITTCLLHFRDRTFRSGDGLLSNCAIIP